MKKGFYRKFAVDSIRKNRQIYLPYPVYLHPYDNTVFYRIFPGEKRRHLRSLWTGNNILYAHNLQQSNGNLCIHLSVLCKQFPDQTTKTGIWHL